MGEVLLMAYVYKDAIYINSEQTRIDCWLDLPEYEGWTPYTLDVNDPDMTIDNAVLLAQMNDAGDIGPYVAPTPPTQAEIDAENARAIRSERDMLLSGRVDPLVSNPLRWNALTTEEQNQVTQYRTELLNITDQASFPSSVTWPTVPDVFEV